MLFQTLFESKNIFFLHEKNSFIRIYSYLFNKIPNNKKLLNNFLYSYLIKYFLFLSRKLFLLYANYRLQRNKYKYLKAGIKNTNFKFLIRDTNSQFHSIYFPSYSNSYEPDVEFSILKLLPKKGVFLDIGSNWGHHSIFANYIKSAKVICFEPNPLVYDDLEKCFSQISFDNKAETYNIGLSIKKGKNIKLFHNGFETGISTYKNELLISRPKKLKSPKILRKFQNFYKTFGNYLNIKANNSNYFFTDIRTLDSFNFAKVDLIKIDAEGNELEILKGGKETLQKLRPFMIFEFYKLKNTINEYIEFLDNISYTIVKLNYSKGKQKNQFVIEGMILDLKSSNNYEIYNSDQYNLIACPNEKLKNQFINLVQN